MALKTLIRWLPVLFVIGISSWIYYVYVFELSIPCIRYGETFWVNASTTAKGAERTSGGVTPDPVLVRPSRPSSAYISLRVTALVFFHLFFFLYAWTYYKVVMTDPGSVPRSVDERHVAETKSDGEGVRQCSKCQNIKPDRTHHCSSCQKCIRKMDHHCPWVNNCVGWSNYKYFFLFLLHIAGLGTYVALTSLSWIVRNALQQQLAVSLQIPVMFIAVCVFAFGMAVFAVTHLRLILINQTTIESFEKRRRRRKLNASGSFEVETVRDTRTFNAYNLGVRRNWRSVFGSNPLLWFLPVFTAEGDGIVFETVEREADEQQERNRLLV